MTSKEPILQLDNVEVHFEQETGFLESVLNRSNNEKVKAVDGVSIDIYEEDVVILVGESGCGKTTLGKTAIGLQRPTGGSVKYRGQDIWAAKQARKPKIAFSQIRKSLQIIHQDPGSALNPNQKIITSLSVPLKRWTDLNKNERIERIHQMLEFVGMSPSEDYAYRYPHQLSGGEKQRTVLIRALLMNPDVILADEAISALDVSLRVGMMDLFLDLQETFGTSFLSISHDLSNARYLAEKADGRIGVMYLGKIVEIGPPEEVINNPQHPYTKALKWATSELYEEKTQNVPLRKIDVPDPSDPPEGCRFHTRCPEAREACVQQSPHLVEGENSEHLCACFRTNEDHEYWQSPEIKD